MNFLIEEGADTCLSNVAVFAATFFTPFELCWTTAIQSADQVATQHACSGWTMSLWPTSSKSFVASPLAYISIQNKIEKPYLFGVSWTLSNLDPALCIVLATD